MREKKVHSSSVSINACAMCYKLVYCFVVHLPVLDLVHHHVVAAGFHVVVPAVLVQVVSG